MPAETAPRDLRSYLAALRRDGHLVEIAAEVDPRLEVAEIHRRVVAAGGPALLFRRVRGADMPVATNLFGTPERIAIAFGRRPKDLVARAAALPETLLPPTAGRLWAHRGLFRDLLRAGTRRRPTGPVLETIERPPRLTRLPVLTTWAKEDRKS